MKVVILGCSKIGALLANWLVSQKHEVSVIDVDVGSFRRLDKETHVRQVVGIPSVLETERAGIATIALSLRAFRQILNPMCFSNRSALSLPDM